MIAMVCLWYNLKANIKKKRYSLYPLGIGSIVFLFLYVLTKLTNASLCPFYHIFHIRCFGCGLTRGFICILEGNWVAATQHHILAIPLFCAIGFYTVLNITDILFSKDYVVKVDRILCKKFMFLIYGIIIVGSYFINYRVF